MDGVRVVMERGRECIGWRTARNDEPVNAWRSESPGNARAHLRDEELDESVRYWVTHGTMSEAEWEAAKGQLLEDFAVELWEAYDRELARIWGGPLPRRQLPPVEHD